MKKNFIRRIVILLAAVLLMALSACGNKDEAAEPADTPEAAQPAEAAAETETEAAAAAEPGPWGEYTATTMISGGETIDIEPMHLTVNEDGSGLMSDNNGSYSVTFFFDDGTGVIAERQSYFTFSLDGDTLILTDGRGAETVFDPDK